MNARHASALVAPDETTQRVWQILEATTDCVLLINKDWKFSFLNRRAIDMVSGGRDLIGLTIWEAFPPVLGTPFEDNYRKAAKDRTPVSFEAFYPDLQILFEVHVCPTTQGGLAIFFRDITEMRAKEDQFRKIEERYRLATLSTTEGIWDWDLVTDTVYYSNRWNEIVGLPAVESTETILHWRERFHPKDLPRLHADFAELETNGCSEFQHEYRICHEDGSWHWILSRGTVVRTVSGKIVRMTGSISDITAKKSIDPLTGLQNRLSLLESLEHRIAKPLINGKTFAVLLICLDRFKQVKESFGPQCGDTALIEIAKRLQSTLEDDDLSVVARISGHEFVILLERIGTVNDVVTYANLLQLLLERPIDCGQHITLATSIGIAMGDEGYALPEKMLEDAAIAMHQAEKVRTPKCVIFGTQMREHTRRRVQIEMDIQGAAQNRQLLLHYQPKIELATGRIIGFEALVRWLHPTLGMISPNDFIPHAEESGIILEIGHWIMREALRQLKAWRAARLIASDVTMAVNLSTKQLEDSFLTHEIQSILACENLPPSCLTLEVTESALIGNLEQARVILMSLRQLGVCLDLDDVGTGYSSLSYLHRLPFHSIKIDRSFIHDLEASQESRLVVQTIIQLGESMNMLVIAEGIETAGQQDRLIQLGCLYGQGFFYSQPLDTKGMELRLSASKLPRTA
jgi:diguanylate cyclase (GGDEF)-like protein/PAS domain S-box-containing protein